MDFSLSPAGQLVAEFDPSTFFSPSSSRRRLILPQFAKPDPLPASIKTSAYASVYDDLTFACPAWRVLLTKLFATTPGTSNALVLFHNIKAAELLLLRSIVLENSIPIALLSLPSFTPSDPHVTALNNLLSAITQVSGRLCRLELPNLERGTTLSHLSKINTWLEALSLWHSSLPSSSISSLANFKSLRTLDISYCSLLEPAIESLGKLTQLAKLVAHYDDWSISFSSLLKAVSGLTQLKTLFLTQAVRSSSTCSLTSSNSLLASTSLSNSSPPTRTIG